MTEDLTHRQGLFLALAWLADENAHAKILESSESIQGHVDLVDVLEWWDEDDALLEAWRSTLMSDVSLACWDRLMAEVSRLVTDPAIPELSWPYSGEDCPELWHQAVATASELLALEFPGALADWLRLDRASIPSIK